MGKLSGQYIPLLCLIAIFFLGLWLLSTPFTSKQTLEVEDSPLSEETIVVLTGTIASDPTITNGVVRFKLGKKQIIGHTADELFYGDQVEISGIQTASGLVKQADITLVEDNSGTITSRLHQLNSALVPVALRYLPEREASVINGMVLGVKPKRDFFFTNAMRKTGTIHILVVSGANLTIVAGFIFGLKRILGIHLTIIITLGVIWFYALLTGAAPPVMRAAIMLTITFIAQAFGRQRWDFYALLTTAALMLLLKRGLLTDISFQLSFSATLGLILFAKPLARKIGAITVFKAKLSSLPFGIADNLATTIAVQLLVDPLILYYFHQFSSVAILANLLVLPLVLYLTVGGALLILLGSVAGILGTVVSLFLLIPVTYFTHILVFLSQLPFASITFASMPLSLVIIYYVLLGFVSLLLFSQAKPGKTVGKNGTIKA